MLNLKQKNNKILYFLSIYLAFDCLLGSLIMPTHAEPAKNNNKSQDISYNGLPYNRRDAGSRGNCLAQGRNVVALVPDRPINKTISTSPQLFFYIPKIEQATEIEFILRNNEDELVYKKLFTPNNQGGIISFSIPETVTENSREANQNYHWYLSLICDHKHRSQDIVLEGWIEYVQLNNPVAAKINASDSITKSNLLQQEGIWYDALSVLAKQKDLDSDSSLIQTKWSELLQSIGLSDLASQPLVEVETVQ